MAIQMPKVLGCEVQDCSYNKSKECHAMAISVGGMKHPVCDTFVKMPSKGGVLDIGGVGACKEDDCKYNNSLECNAPGIQVGFHMDHADCKTFAPTRP